MTREEANEILDSQKDGTRLHSILKVTQALWTTGDIARRLPSHTRPFSQDGINEWVESSRMVQSTGIGQPSNRDLERNKSGFNQKNERNQ
jgi:hypothetical protein